MKKKYIFLFILIFIAAVNINAQIVIKMGCVAPAGSLWDMKLKELAASWKKVSNGEVELKLYMGGAVADEDDMIRKMKMGGLNAGAMTTQGVKGIAADSFALCLPFVVKDDDEFNYVFDKMKPSFEKAIEKNGFVTVGWAMTGWVNFFSKYPVTTPDDLKKQKIAIDTDGRLSKIWTDLGFHAIPLAFNDLIAGLYSGMAEATYLTPLAASSMGMLKITPYMCDLKISPVYCGLVVEKRAWNRIPEKHRENLKQATAEITKQFYDIIKTDEAKAIDVMLKDSLVITEVKGSVADEWFEIGKAGSEIFSKELISKEIYDEMAKYIDEYRKK